MRRSKYRRTYRKPGRFSGRRRLVAVAATLVVFGGIATVTQISDAGTGRTHRKALAACDDIATPPPAELSTQTRKGTWTTNGGTVTQHADDGAGDTVTSAELRDRCRRWVMDNVGETQDASSAPTTAATPSTDPSVSPSEVEASPAETTTTTTTATTAAPAPTASDGGGSATPPPGAGLGVLTNSCDTSTLSRHDGFQNGDRCVSTQFGEVGTAANNPSLLITAAPRTVTVNTPFTLKISTRNLIRDRFLAAGKGGYYVESSVLQDGLVRGHFHTACRMLTTTREAPASDPVPAFFVATEDSQGGATPDEVTIAVPGMPTTGTAQCASWAGDGSHRIPMMQRANQTPAFDAVRITVRPPAD